LSTNREVLSASLLRQVKLSKTTSYAMLVSDGLNQLVASTTGIFARARWQAFVRLSTVTFSNASAMNTSIEPWMESFCPEDLLPKMATTLCNHRCGTFTINLAHTMTPDDTHMFTAVTLTFVPCRFTYYLAAVSTSKHSTTCLGALPKTYYTVAFEHL